MGFKRKVWMLVIWACFLLISTPTWAANIYVSPTGAGTGTKLKPASLQHALDIANGNGQNDTLYLQTGTYAATAAFTYGSGNDGKSVTLSGGWNIGFAQKNTDRTLTVLDGGGTNRVLALVNDVNGSNTTFTLQDLTVQDGALSGAGGAGIWATETGGGVLHLIVRNCLFNNNINTNSSGGAIYVYCDFEIYDSAFSSNSASSGGAIYTGFSVPLGISPVIDGCTFDNNMSTGWQGSTIFNSNVNLTVRDSIFTGRTDGVSSSGSGSTIYNHTASHLSVYNSLFQKNLVDYWGSAIQFWDSGGVIENSVFIQNNAGSNYNDGYGAITYLNNTLAPETIIVTNCTFSGNRSLTSGIGPGGAIHSRGGNLTIANSIFWDNGPLGLYYESGYGDPGSATISYSDIEGGLGSTGVVDGGNNVTGNPQFVAAGDYHLAVGSPCIDKGDNAALVLPLTDIDGDYRLLDGDTGNAVVDMGADEYSPTFSAVTVLAPEPGEIIVSGSQYVVGWGAPDTAVGFKVSYSTDNGLTWKPIGTTADERAILWYVPQVRKNLTKCIIKVTGYDDKGKLVGAGKSSPFTTEVIHFLTPAPGEIIHPSETRQYTIEWRTSNPNATLFKLYYSMNNGATWQRGDQTQYGVSGTTFTTPILAPDSGNKWLMLKIVGYNASHAKVAEGVSDKILLEVLKVTDPNGGGSVKGGTPGSISWHLYEPVDPVLKVILSYTLDGGATWKKITTLGSPYTLNETLHTYAAPSFNWPVVTKPKTRCKVKVVIKDDQGFTMGTDVSDTIFTITP